MEMHHDRYQDQQFSPLTADKISSVAIFSLLPATAVIRALSGCFTMKRQNRSELAVATCDRIQLFTFDEELEPHPSWTFNYPAILGMHLLKNRYSVKVRF